MNERGRVVITGASSGIGEATALHLRELGFSVLAGVRREEDAERLRKEGLTPLRLDVTAADELLSAGAGSGGDQPLVGLVNNAGIMQTGPLEFMSLDDLRHQMEVNVIGQLAVTQVFLDALRAGRGRIVNVGSLAGVLATPMTGPYVVSKFAMEGMNDVLRRELILQGIDVVMVAPGGVDTSLIGKATRAIEQILLDGPPELAHRYGPMITAQVKLANTFHKRSVDARAVAEVIGKALTVRRPRTRYLVGQDAIIGAKMVKWIPDRVMDRLMLKLVKSK